MKALKQKTVVVEIDEEAKIAFDAYIKSTEVKAAEEDQWCKPVADIFGRVAVQKSYGTKMAFITYGLKALTDKKIEALVKKYGKAGDKKLTNRYEEIRDYLIIRREAAAYAKNHDGPLDEDMKAFLKRQKKEKKKFGPAVAFVANNDEEMMGFAEKMKKAGWIDSIHTNDTSKSLKLANLPDEKMPERVFILGHGSPGTPFLHLGDEHWDGKQIADMLIQQGLPAKIRQIEVLGCYGAKGTKKKVLKAREKYMEAIDNYEAAKLEYDNYSDGDKSEKKALKKAMDKAESAQTKAKDKYTDEKNDPDNFYTIKVKKPEEFGAWNLPFVAALVAQLKDNETRKFTQVHVLGYTAPFILHYSKNQIRYFDVTGMKTEGFISHKREHSEYYIKRQVETDEEKTGGRVYVEPVGPVNLNNGDWIDANPGIRKIWT